MFWQSLNPPPKIRPWVIVGGAGGRRGLHAGACLLPHLPVQGGRVSALPAGWPGRVCSFRFPGRAGGAGGCLGPAPGQAAGCLAAPWLADGSRAKAVLSLPRRRAHAVHRRPRSGQTPLPALCFQELGPVPPRGRGTWQEGEGRAFKRDLWGFFPAGWLSVNRRGSEIPCGGPWRPRPVTPPAECGQGPPPLFQVPGSLTSPPRRKDLQKASPATAVEKGLMFPGRECGGVEEGEVSAFEF